MDWDRLFVQFTTGVRPAVRKLVLEEIANPKRRIIAGLWFDSYGDGCLYAVAATAVAPELMRWIKNLCLRRYPIGVKVILSLPFLVCLPLTIARILGLPFREVWKGTRVWDSMWGFHGEFRERIRQHLEAEKAKAQAALVAQIEEIVLEEGDELTVKTA